MLMNDSFGRNIDYLRISVTDRCNLRCLYCMPAAGISRMKHSDILSYEEIERIVRAAVECGVKKIRLTGGEPLVRPGIVELVRMLSCIEGIDEVSITTNAILLEELAEPLADAGLKRVNISLDTLNPERYRHITRTGDIERVFSGIDAAERAGFGPLKINTVAIRGFNDDEIISLSEWALQNDLHLRFIEFMPTHENSFHHNDSYLSADIIREQLFMQFADLKPCPVTGNGPAVSWHLEDKPGSVGIIEAVSHSFCSSCNRLRLTADGKLKPCLFSNKEVDLLDILRGDARELKTGLQRLIYQAVEMKPESHRDFKHVDDGSRCMNEIGG